MKAFKTPIHGIGTFLLPLSIYAVVLMDFWTDVAHKGQQVIQDFIPVLPEEGLKDGHLLLGVLLYFSAAATMGSQSRSFLGLELLLPLQAVLFNFSLGFFFGLLQPPVLSLAGLGHLLSGPFLRLEQLLDALRLTGHGYGDGASGGDSEAADSGLPQPNRQIGRAHV